MTEGQHAIRCSDSPAFLVTDAFFVLNLPSLLKPWSETKAPKRRYHET